MSRRGIIGVGPVLLFVPLVSLLVTGFVIIAGLGLVSGLVFNRHIRDMNKKALAARALVIFVLMLGVMACVHFIGGPTSNLFIGMLLGTVAFGLAVGLLSWNSIREDSRQAARTIGILTLLFLIISEASVYIALRV